MNQRIVKLDEEELIRVMKAEEALLGRPVIVAPIEDKITNHIAMAGMANMNVWDRPWQRMQENAHNQNYEELVGMHAKLDADGTYHYASMDDLPEVGRGDHPYKITSTLDMFRYRGDRYIPHNPYGAVSLHPLTINTKCEEIVDESAGMPFGGTGPLSVVWNVHALRRDLWAKGVRDWTYADMMPKAERWRLRADMPLAEQRSLYFRHAHRQLANQLRTEVRDGSSFRVDYVESLERIGVEMFITEKGYTGFKDGEFVVVIE